MENASSPESDWHGPTNAGEAREEPDLRSPARAHHRTSPPVYWAIRLFCSTSTRLSVQNVQPGP